MDNTVPKVDISDLAGNTFLQRYQKPGKPVLITGLLGKDVHWHLDDLINTIGDKQVFVRHYGQQRYQQTDQQWQSIGSGIDPIEMSFRKYAELIKNGQAKADDLYLAKSPLKGTSLGENPSLKHLGNNLNLKPVTDYRMYMGHGGHTASLHYDI